MTRLSPQTPYRHDRHDRHRPAPARVPDTETPWLVRGLSGGASRHGGEEHPHLRGGYDASLEAVQRYAGTKPWLWTGERVYFLCDIHADAQAFVDSLVATGGVRQTGPTPNDVALTDDGRGATFVIGGDCFDKGPSTLELLDAIAALVRTGAQVRILAGNHDVRTIVGLASIGRKDPRHAHLFVRMGKKTMPLLAEVWRRMLAPMADQLDVLDDDEARELLMPPESWFDDFPAAARGWVAAHKVSKELVRIREKMADLEAACVKLGVTMGQLHAAAVATRDLFMEPTGAYHWFFDHMDLAYRAGSYLFLHAGLDDRLAAVLRGEGVDGLNARFRQLMDERHFFTLYHGAVGNAFRTKYRAFDWPLTREGVRDTHGSGVYAIVHGHRNVLHGQRIVLRAGLMHFECDASVDRTTRDVEGLEGAGAAVVVFEPDGRVRAVSADHPTWKVFRPAEVSRLFTVCRDA